VKVSWKERDSAFSTLLTLSSLRKYPQTLAVFLLPKNFPFLLVALVHWPIQWTVYLPFFHNKWVPRKKQQYKFHEKKGIQPFQHF
jgi:hypothetical protein